MKRIKKLVDNIKDEMCSAKNYAEEYLYYKAKGNSSLANKYKEMSNQEIQHAINIHDVVVSEIEELKKIYTPPTEMMDKWEHEHKEYVEKTAWIKQMLLM